MSYNIQRNISIIQIEGFDAKQFLQSIITNNLQDCGTYTFILSAQGRYLFDFFIHTVNINQYFIEIDNALVQDFIAYVTFFKLRRRLNVQNVNEDFVALYTDATDKEKPVKYLSCIQDTRYDKLGRRIICTKEVLAVIQDEPDMYLSDKYKYCIPDGHIDMQKNKSVILEFGAEKLNGISFSKGCFPGQELMSRTKHQGQLKKQIFKIFCDGDLGKTEKFSPLYCQAMNITVGRFCSGYQGIGIALLREDLLKEGGLLFSQSNKGISFAIPSWRK